MANILIVDDNPSDRSLLVKFLARSGHTLREATDGAEALAMVAAERPDLVITDILMPTTDGYEFVRLLRSCGEIEQTPVIFCTAHFRKHDANDLARKCGVEYVLVKPLDLDLASAAIDACLNKLVPSPVPPIEENFDREHLQLLLNKLNENTDKLTLVNLRLEELIETTLLGLASEREPARLIQEFCRSARHLVSAKFALIGIGDEGNQASDLLTGAGIHWENHTGSEGAQQTHTAVAALFESGPKSRPVRVRNPTGDPTVFGFPSGYPSFDSILAAPIASPSRTYGWLCLFQKLGAIEFTADEERLAGILGGLAGRIYENASLYALAQNHAFRLEQELAERKCAEAEARHAVERLNLALKASRTGIWTWDAINDLIVWDENTYAIFGVTPGGFGGTFQHFAALIHPEDRDAAVGAVRQCTPGQPEYIGAFRVIWPTGAVHYLEASGRAFYDEAGQLVRITGTARDISEQRQLEEQFRQAQKMEAVGQLAGGIAHDFNNVLNVIIGYSRLMLESSALPASTSRRVDEIRKAGERAAGLTQQLLAFSRKQVLQPRVLNLAVILNDLDHMIRRTIGEDIDVLTTIDEKLAQVTIDPGQVQQVLLNLVINARDAMPQGGKLTLELTNREVDASSGLVHGLPAGRYVMLSVSDNGSGMTPEVRQRVFEPFFTTKEVGQGTGLGLATVYGIVKQSGGHIWLYSEPGIGTTFKIFLPRIDEPSEMNAVELPKERAGGQETILIVEDDPALRALVLEILRSVGYNVLIAENGDDALRASQQYAGPIQLLLTDVVLPKMSGKEIANRLAPLRPEMKVLFTSGYTGIAIAQHGTLEPSAAFIQKPWTPEGLCNKVRAVLNTRRSLQRILVVDDEPGILNWLREVLEGTGYQLLTAKNGREARALLSKHPVDLVMTDLVMPEEEGIEMMRAIRKDHPRLKVVAMSGEFGPDLLTMAKFLGAQATLTKPLTAEEVIHCVADLLEPCLSV